MNARFFDVGSTPSRTQLRSREEVAEGRRQFHPCRLKNWTARSCFSAAARVANVPRLRRLLVLGFGLREYNRYLPDWSFLIMMFKRSDSLRAHRFDS
jgi:hypothetical protein